MIFVQRSGILMTFLLMQTTVTGKEIIQMYHFLRINQPEDYSRKVYIS